MRLVACPSCHDQYDVTGVDEPYFDCRCGTTIRNETHAAVDARMLRCSSCGAALAEGSEQCAYCHSVAVPPDDAELSLICPECYARNTEDSRFCTGCGVEFRPQPLPAEQEAPLRCPCCDVEMAHRGIGGVWVQECAKCNGLWAPGDRFDALVDRALDAARVRQAGFQPVQSAGTRTVERSFEYRHCPVCNARMLRKNYGKRSGVIVDWCGSDGVWLDADESRAHRGLRARRRPARCGHSARGVPGLSSGGRLNAEQMRAVTAVDHELARERARAEGAWDQRGPGVSLVRFLLDLIT